MLGLHGNTTVQTPAFDALAAQGTSFDFAFSPSCDLPLVLKKMFSGSSQQPITATINGRSTFVSDCDVAASIAETVAFDSIVTVQPNSSKVSAATLEETQAANFFAAAIEAVLALHDDDLLWLHFSGLSSTWDAPLPIRENFRAMDDPEPYAEVKPPRFSFDARQDDPDLLLSVQQACFAQVVVIDQMLGIFLEHLDRHWLQSPNRQTASVMVAGLRGYGLGEHGYVGIAHDLYAQSLHVPLLVRLSEEDEAFQNLRSHELIHTSLIGDWIIKEQAIKSHGAIMINPDAPPLFFEFQNQTAIQTHSWKYLRHVDKDGVLSEQLFAKPDDRWEVNDVASRCPQIVEELEQLLR